MADGRGRIWSGAPDLAGRQKEEGELKVGPMQREKSDVRNSIFEERKPKNKKRQTKDERRNTKGEDADLKVGATEAENVIQCSLCREK